MASENSDHSTKLTLLWCFFPLIGARQYHQNCMKKSSYYIMANIKKKKKDKTFFGGWVHNDNFAFWLIYSCNRDRNVWKWISLRDPERKHMCTAALSSATLSALARSGRVKAFPLLSHSTGSLIGEIIYLISTQWVIHWDSCVAFITAKSRLHWKKANVRW